MVGLEPLLSGPLLAGDFGLAEPLLAAAAAAAAARAAAATFSALSLRYCMANRLSDALTWPPDNKAAKAQ